MKLGLKMGTTQLYVITENASETIEARWDGERFSIVMRLRQTPMKPKIIILNPEEAKKLIAFIKGALNVSGIT